MLLKVIVLVAQLGAAFEQAEQLRTDGRLREALLAYQQATLAMSDPAPAYRNAAMIELALGDRELARIDYERYLDLRPQADDAAQVRAVLAELDRIASQVKKGSCQTGDALFEQGLLAKAAAMYEGCLAQDDRDASLWRRMARALMRLGNRRSALAAYRTYLKLSPDAPDALFVRAILRAG